MFGVTHYVPILRWKRAEKVALRNLQPHDRSVVTPLIEFIPPNFKPGRDGSEANPALVLERQAGEIAKNWGLTPVFVDLLHVEEDIPPIEGALHALDYFSAQALRQNVYLIPVTGLMRSPGHRDAIKRAASSGRGVCFRLEVSQILQPDFSRHLLREAGAVGDHGAVDLILDYGVFGESAPTMEDVISLIPDVGSWRSLTWAAGAFPQNLQEYTPGRHTRDRADWQAYKSQVSSSELMRLPAFGDYTVQYGAYKEPPEHSNPSASIRYALEDEWVIMRGEGLFNDDAPGHEQYCANAILLSESDEFYGANFSYGDSYIHDVAQGIKDHGNPETWIRAGINHHITVTCRQVAGLASSLGNDGRRRANARIRHAPLARSISTRGA